MQIASCHRPQQHQSAFLVGIAQTSLGIYKKMIRIGDLQAFVVIKQVQSKVWTGLIFCAEHLDLSKALKQAFDDVRLGASPDEADARSDLKESNLPRHSLTKKTSEPLEPNFWG
jgi:hypothetical protein